MPAVVETIGCSIVEEALGVALIQFTAYAEARIQRRRLSKELVLMVLDAPEQVIEEDDERMVAQSRLTDANSGQQRLLRVVYEQHEDQKIVITAYETSKMRKYWRAP
ncbi:MAG TPA: DUF4258 domain-containing protein [Dehalococcoidia bacterium]|nr:DUF4258 domain-containing protein [Dehalococcoidia bacterium]